MSKGLTARQQNSAQRNENTEKAYEYYSRQVSALTGVSIEQITGKSRVTDIVNARHMVSYLMAKNHGFTWKAIGDAVGRDHSTIINSVEVVADGLEMPWDNRFKSISKVRPYSFEQVNDAWDGDGME
jgi:chromosomal replication initiation ATPase DnaA